MSYSQPTTPPNLSRSCESLGLLAGELRLKQINIFLRNFLITAQFQQNISIYYQLVSNK